MAGRQPTLRAGFPIRPRVRLHGATHGGQRSEDLLHIALARRIRTEQGTGARSGAMEDSLISHDELAPGSREFVRSVATP